MTTAAWPADIPQCPILNGWNETPQPNVGSFVPEVGPSKMKRRSTAKTWLSSLTYRMTTTQVVAFKTFYETTLEDGTLPFTWNHPVEKTNYNWNFDPGTQPMITRLTPTTHSVQFKLQRLPA
jgi:hypothetical protein